MTEQEHTDITNILTTYITENGKHQYDDPIPNCWEAGMMKAILLINQYIREKRETNDA